MDPDDVTPAVFLSYAGPERQQAREVRTALEQRGIRVLMDVDFEPGQDALVSIGHAISSGVFLPLISTAYLDRPFTQLEVSAAVMTGQDNMFLPILIENAPAPVTEKGRNLWTVLNGRTYWLAEMTPESFDELARQVRRKAGYRAQQLVPLPNPMITTGLNIALIYDWEDGHLADGIARQCEHAGLTVAAMVVAGAPEAMRALPPEAHIAVLWTTAAQGSPEVAEEVVSALAIQRKLLYLVLPDSPPCPNGVSFMRLESAGNTTGRPERPASRWARDRMVLRARLGEALRMNDGVPFHLLGDKFCASRDAAAATAAAYQLAVYQFPPLDEARLEAVLAYTAVAGSAGSGGTQPSCCTPSRSRTSSPG